MTLSSTPLRHARRLRRAWPWAVGLLATAAVVPAFADLVDAYFPPGIIGPADRVGVTVNSRERPATDPLGVRVGAYTIRPNIEIGPGYDSNPFFQRRARPSMLARTSASLGIGSNWSTDNVFALVTLDDNRYPGLRNQSTTNWTASLGKVFNFGTDKLTLVATHLDLHQTARDLNAPALDAPGRYQVNNARATYQATVGQFVFEPQLQYTGYRYDAVSVAGARSAQNFRDRDIIDGQLTTKFDVALLRDLAVVLRGASIQYHTAAPGQLKPDATSVAVLAGIDHATSAVWRYRLIAGMQARQSRSPAVRTRSAPIAEANVIYMPSGLTTVGLTVVRAVEDAAGEFAAAFTYTAARLSIDHELTRDILLHGHVGLERAEYDRGKGAETLTSALASATWLMNRNMRLVGSYSWTQKERPTGGAVSESLALLRLQMGL